MAVRPRKQEWVKEYLDASNFRGGEFRKEVSELLERQTSPKVCSVQRGQGVHEETGVYVLDTHGSDQGPGPAGASSSVADVSVRCQRDMAASGEATCKYCSC